MKKEKDNDIVFYKGNKYIIVNSTEYMGTKYIFVINYLDKDDVKLLACLNELKEVTCYELSEKIMEQMS